MTLSPFRPKTPDLGNLDSEALIKEARRLRRRRWLIGSFLAALLLFLSGLGLLLAGRRSLPRVSALANQPPPPTVPPQATVSPRTAQSQPFVNASAFAGNGNLAFVSNNTLWILDGSTQSLKEVAGVYSEDPKFSSGGKWLAYLTYTPLKYPGIGPTAGQLWIARSDGSDPHKISGLPDVAAISWSPNSDLLAVGGGSTPGIYLVNTSGSTHEIPGTSHASKFVWSPDGTEIAYSGWYKYGGLRTVPVSGGSPVLWESTYNIPQYPNSSNPTIPAAWLPNGQGLLFWIDPQSSASLETGGLSLYLLSNPGGKPHLLGTTLVSPSSVTVSKSGNFAITEGSGRYQWSHKTVAICSAGTGICKAVPSEKAQVSFDPYWDQSGKMLYYSEGPDNGQAPFPQAALSKWYSEISLKALNLGEGTSSEVPGGSGGAATLSSSGQKLLFESGDALWMKSAGSSSPVEIEHPLFPVNSWPTTYAQVDWSQQFSWNQAPS